MHYSIPVDFSFQQLNPKSKRSNMASTFTSLTYHVVDSTKYRRPTIATDWQTDLYEYIVGMIREREGMAIQIGGMADHIHILTNLSPKLAIVDVLREIKVVSRKWINDRGLVSNRFEWQTGYGAFSVSHSQSSDVQAYV